MMVRFPEFNVRNDDNFLKSDKCFRNLLMFGLVSFLISNTTNGIGFKTKNIVIINYLNCCQRIKNFEMIKLQEN